MSHNFDKGPGFNSMSKNGKIFVTLHVYFSRIHKIKTRTSIENLRHSSRHLNVP